MGVAPQWAGRAQDPEHGRDTHFEIEGPVVAQMQPVFIDNWIEVTGDVLHGADYSAALVSAGPAAAQTFSNAPSGGSESMQLMVLLAVTAASRSIDLSAAYFVPDASTTQPRSSSSTRPLPMSRPPPSKPIWRWHTGRATPSGWPGPGASGSANGWPR